MQLSKNWETDLPHAEFMAVVRRMSRGNYRSSDTWSAFDRGRWERKGYGALGGGAESSGRSKGRPRVYKSNGDGNA